MRKLLVLSVLAAAVSFAFVSRAEWRRRTGRPPRQMGVLRTQVQPDVRQAGHCRAARPTGGGRSGAVAQVSIQLAVGGEEIEGKDWSELADKLKAPALKKEGSDMLHKLRVFNQLGLEGWEVVSHAGADGIGTSGTGSWMLKRRVP